MTNMDALRNKPVGLFRMDDATPFTDYSGYNRSGTLSGTEKKGVPLTVDATYSQLLDSTTTATFASPVYGPGSELRPFSLSAVICPVLTTGSADQQILSNQNIYDGLTLNGTVVSFSTRYTNTGEAKCSYDLGSVRRADLVGVHTREKNSLYVDGKLVDEVDISTAQRADTYAAPNSNLYSGLTTGSQGVLVNNIGMFNRILQPEEISRMSTENARRATGNVPRMYDGQDIFVSTAVRTPYLDTGWFDEEDWRNANLNNVTTDGEQLVATMNNGLTMAGTWTDSVDLYSGTTPTPLNSMYLWWESKNATVEASVDGTTWVSVTRGQNLSIIPTGFDPTNKALYVRITFAAGLSEAYVDSMRVVGFTSSTAVSNNRVVTYNNPVTTMGEFVPAEMRNNWGSRIGSGGSISIAPDVIGDTPMAVRTIEVWIRPETAGLSVGATGSFTNYLNGSAGAASGARIGEWSVVHFVAAADVTSNITISGGEGTVGKVAIYPNALTASEIAAIVANYTGVYTQRYDMTGIVSIAESGAPATIYAHDWEIQSS